MPRSSLLPHNSKSAHYNYLVMQHALSPLRHSQSRRDVRRPASLAFDLAMNWQ